MDIGTRELVIIAIVLVFLFGAKKIPALAKSVGDAIKELRKGFSGNTNDTTIAQQTKDAVPKKK